jgi:uncharacterized LabA/DUF88 family protein
MEDITYLFIDGGYLTKLYSETVAALFGGQWTINYQQMCGVLHARKSFYYDCLDETSRKDESDADHIARIERQKEEFERIRSVKGTHVRLGKLVGDGKRKRQKEVDVLLAVDMLNHAYRQNMSRAILIAGDRDYRPLVESLVQIGTFVEVHCGKRAAAELYRAADHHEFLNVEELCRWTLSGLQFPHCGQPNENQDALLNPSWVPVKTGKTALGEVRLYKVARTMDAEVLGLSIQLGPSKWRAYQFHELQLMERFIGMQYDINIEWSA